MRLGKGEAGNEFRGLFESACPGLSDPLIFEAAVTR
jgi:hypothetical protein